jgi:hypothetical protein
VLLLRCLLPLVFLLGSLLLVPSLRGQAPGKSLDRNLRIFLDCVDFGCDRDYFRTEIGYVSYVRDPTQADVHVLITRVRTGSGGRDYTLTFIGRGSAARQDTLHYFSTEAASDDMRRDGLARVIALGLMPYVAHTPAASRIQIEYSGPAEGANVAPIHDPWNNWVFEAEADADFDGEASSDETELSGSFVASRVTDRWKLNVGISGRYSKSRFDIDSVTTVRSDSKSYGASALAIRSVSPHWALAGGVSADRSTYLNRALGLRVAPGVEYDFFPYRESTRRLLTVRYMLGLNYYRYDELTLFGRTRETLLDETLRASLESRQPWGSADISLEAAHYLDDFGKNRVELSSDLEIRLTQGLSLEVYGSVERVHDQRYLPAAGATPDEILLQRRALATDYRYRLSLGLNYSFGSIFNNVVNPRFGEGGAGGGLLLE